MFKFFGPTSESFAKYDAFCSHIFDYACLRRKASIAIEGVRDFGKIRIHQKHFCKWLVGGCITYLSSYSPGSAPGHKLQKQSKECNMLQSLGTISFFFFLLKGRFKKGGRHGTISPPEYALNTRKGKKQQNEKCCNMQEESGRSKKVI